MQQKPKKEKRNNMEKKNAAGGGIGFCGVLAIVFIVLKLTKLIAWDWLWVLAPIWIPVALGGIFFVLFFIIVVLSSMMDK